MSLGWLDLDEGNLDAAEEHLCGHLPRIGGWPGRTSAQLGLESLAYARSDTSRRGHIREALALGAGQGWRDSFCSAPFSSGIWKKAARLSHKAARIHSAGKRAMPGACVVHRPIPAAYLAALVRPTPTQPTSPLRLTSRAKLSALCCIERSQGRPQGARVLLNACAHLSGPALESFWRNSQCPDASETGKTPAEPQP
jgi:hypothetical protein